MCYKKTARRATVAAGAAIEKEENERHGYGFLIMGERAGSNQIGLFALGLFPTDYSPV